MMEDHGMHDGHQAMEHNHSVHDEHGTDPLAQHHSSHDSTVMGHMQHMMHSMTVSSLKIYNNKF